MVDTESLFNYLFLDALKNKHKEQYNQALQSYSNCYKLDDKSSLIPFEISRLYLAANQYEEANLWIDRALANDTTHNTTYIKYATSLKIYFGMYENAKNLYLNLVTTEPEEPTHKLMLARLYSQLNKPDSAHMWLDRISTDRIPWLTIQLEHVDLYERELNPRKAEKVLYNILKHDQITAEPYIYLSKYYFKVKDDKKALKMLFKGLEKEKGELVLFDLADYYLSNKDIDSFKKYSLQACRSELLPANSKTEKIKFYLSYSIENKIFSNEDNFILNLINAAVEKDPDDEQLNYLLASYLSYIKENVKVISLMKKYLSNHNPDVNYYTLLIYTLLNADNPDWPYIEKVVDKGLNFYYTHNYLVLVKALCYNNQKDFSSSVTLLTKFFEDVDIDKSSNDKQSYVDLLNILAESYYYSGDTANCFSTYDKLLSLDTSNFLALNNYSYYLSLLGERLDEAEKMSRITVQAEPTNSTYLDTYAWVLFKKKQYSLSLIMIESAINCLKSESAEIREHYGDILSAMGRNEDAVVQWKIAYSLDTSKQYLLEKNYQ